MTTIVIALFVLSIVILTSIMGGVIFLLRKYSSSRGDYYTQEDEGDKLAEDADTAVLRAKTGSQVKMRREWFI